MNKTIADALITLAGVAVTAVLTTVLRSDE